MSEPEAAFEPLDELDQKLLARLMRQGRATWADLADELGVTAPAIAQRVRRLEDRGVIRQFAAWVAPEAVAPVTAWVAVRLDRADQREHFHQRALESDAIQECHRVTGDDDYLLKVRCASVAALDEFLSITLARWPGVGRTRASLVLATVKDTPVLPLPDGKKKKKN